MGTPLFGCCRKAKGVSSTNMVLFRSLPNRDKSCTALEPVISRDKRLFLRRFLSSERGDLLAWPKEDLETACTHNTLESEVMQPASDKRIVASLEGIL